MRLSPARAAQITGGAGLAAAVVVGAGAAVFAALPGRSHDPIRVQAQPPAAPAVAVCSGPLLAAGRDATQASLLGDGAPQQITVGATAGADLTDALLTPADVAAGAGPAVQTATPPASSSDPADLAVAGSAQVAASDLTGFAAEACTRASMESWLVGGSGTTGAGDLVVLANPGDVAAQVTLAVYGATGAQTPAAGKNIVVPARTQRVIPLAAIALGEENPVVRVTSAQAPVRASLQATLTRVLNPGGVDQIAALGAPRTDLVIPAVPVTVPPGDPGASNTPTSLYLLAPAAAGEATVTVTGDGGAVASTQNLPLLAGIPLTLDLGSLAVGTYTVSITATTPITGAVWTTTGFGAGSDFGVFTPAEVLGSATLAAVAEGPSPQLSLVGASAGGATVTIERLDGSDAQQITVPEGRTVLVPVEGGTVYRVTPTGTVRASVAYSGAGAVAGYPIAAGDAAAAAIEVYPR